VLLQGGGRGGNCKEALSVPGSWAAFGAFGRLAAAGGVRRRCAGGVGSARGRVEEQARPFGPGPRQRPHAAAAPVLLQKGRQRFGQRRRSVGTRSEQRNGRGWKEPRRRSSSTGRKGSSSSSSDSSSSRDSSSDSSRNSSIGIRGASRVGQDQGPVRPPSSPQGSQARRQPPRRRYVGRVAAALLGHSSSSSRRRVVRRRRVSGRRELVFAGRLERRSQGHRRRHAFNRARAVAHLHLEATRKPVHLGRGSHQTRLP
jgi:hypothetical protein